MLGGMSRRSKSTTLSDRYEVRRQSLGKSNRQRTCCAAQDERSGRKLPVLGPRGSAAIAGWGASARFATLVQRGGAGAAVGDGDAQGVGGVVFLGLVGIGEAEAGGGLFGGDAFGDKSGEARLVECFMVAQQQ